MNNRFIFPDWPAPKWVKSVMTTRLGGHSQGDYASFNLATHVGDNPQHVKANRELLRNNLNLPSEPLWLQQTHGIEVVNAALVTEPNPIADACYSPLPQKVCVVLTADCLPVLFYSTCSDEIAAAHAGWKGIRDGILERTVQQFQVAPKFLHAWLGVAIGPQQFEVGREVYQEFIESNGVMKNAFVVQPNGKYFANIYELACIKLRALGVTKIFGAKGCTVSAPQQFFSYRREKNCGRMASLIWIDKEP